MTTHLSQQAEAKLTHYFKSLAMGYGVKSVSKKFAVTPSVAQKLVDKIVETDTFFKKINSFPVTELKGDRVIGSVVGVHPKRTNTELNDRQTGSVVTLEQKGYELFFTENDTHLTYAKIDTWAKFPDFKERYGGWLREAQAMARLTTGWYGTHAAAVTDFVANPNFEDVNKGWLQILREYQAGSQWYLQGATANQIRIGAGGDFVNLDTAVHACLQMIDPIYRRKNDLVALIGEDLLATDKAALYQAQGATPSEKERIANEKVTRTYANLSVDTPSGFPSRGLVITSYNNLSWYYQDSSIRRQVIDNPKRNRIEEYSSVNDGFIIEDEEKAAGFEFKNIKLKDAAGNWV